jgi:hypothetical protein
MRLSFEDLQANTSLACRFRPCEQSESECREAVSYHSGSLRAVTMIQA